VTIYVPPKRILTQQPQSLLRISDSPISDGLVAFVNPATQYTSVLNKFVTYTGSASLAVDEYGYSYDCNETSSPIDIGAASGIQSILDQTKPWSIACKVKVTTLTDQTIIGDHNTSADNLSFYLASLASGTFTLVGFKSDYTIGSQISGGSSSLGWHDILAVFSGGSNFTAKLYVDGVLVGTGSASSAQQATGTALRLGMPGSYASAGFNGQIAYAAFFGLDKSQYVNQLKDNPWQLLSTHQNNLYFQGASEVDLSSASVSTASASGTITSQIAIAGASVSSTIATGGLNSSIDLAGSAQAASVATGAITSILSLSGASASSTIAGGQLTLNMIIAGDAIASSVGVGQLLMEQALSGSGAAQSSASGSLDGGAGLSGAAIAQAVASGAITMTMTLSGASLSSALASAGMVMDQPLSGASISGSIAAGDLTSLAGGALAGASQSTASATGQLFIDVPISGAATASVSGTGNITAIMPISGASAAITNAAGDLTVSLETDLSGNALAQVLAGGDIKMTLTMDGASVSQAMATAALSTDLDTSAIYDTRFEVIAILRNYEVRA